MNDRPTDIANLNDMLIKDMYFDNKIVGTRIINILRNKGIHNLAQLLELSKDDLLNMRGFGTVCFAELIVKLEGLHLQLRQESRW